MIGTFALLYFGGYTLNTLTFGGLALGIGMIVDAAIVVLENTYRHLEMGKDRMTAAIDGSEEVWSAILASTLTHIAVFVPMLFLTGVSSIMFGQLAAVVSFSLAMSLFVAVTIVPVLCSRLLRLPPPHGKNAKGVFAGCSAAVSTGCSTASTRSTPARCTWRCTTGRRCSRRASACSSSPSFLLPRIGFEFQPTTDEGEVTVDAELAVGTRIENTEAVLIQLEERIREVGARSDDADHPGGRRRRLRERRPPTAAASTCGWCRRTERTRSNEQICDGPAPPARRACPASSSAPAPPAART